MNELIQKPHPSDPNSLKTLPSTKHEAVQAAKNREQLSEETMVAAKKICGYLEGGGTVLDVALGPKTHATVDRVNPDSRMLRVKIFDDKQPHASFIYKALYGEGPNDSWATSVVEEKPDASGPDIQLMNGDPRDIRGIKLGPGLRDIIYAGSEQVQDFGAMDFAITAQTIHLAANQIDQITANEPELAAA